MEPFWLFRHGLGGEESIPGGAVRDAASEQAELREAEAQAKSKLGALLVILLPFGLVAWVAIGIYLYRLLT